MQEKKNFFLLTSVINFTLFLSSLNDLDLLFYRKHSCCELETLSLPRVLKIEAFGTI